MLQVAVDDGRAGGAIFAGARKSAGVGGGAPPWPPIDCGPIDDGAVDCCAIDWGTKDGPPIVGGRKPAAPLVGLALGNAPLGGTGAANCMAPAKGDVPF